MATVWIATIGNSDVRLNPDAQKVFISLRDDRNKPEKQKNGTLL